MVVLAIVVEIISEETAYCIVNCVPEVSEVVIADSRKSTKPSDDFLLINSDSDL